MNHALKVTTKQPATQPLSFAELVAAYWAANDAVAAGYYLPDGRRFDTLVNRLDRCHCRMLGAVPSNGAELAEKARVLAHYELLDGDTMQTSSDPLAALWRDAATLFAA